MVDLKKDQLVDELPMPPQPRVGSCPQEHRLFICKMRLRMDETHNTVMRSMTPSALHETSIQIGTQSAEGWEQRWSGHRFAQGDLIASQTNESPMVSITFQRGRLEGAGSVRG